MHRDVELDVCGEAIAPGGADFWSEENSGRGRVVGAYTSEFILSFRFARSDELNGEAMSVPVDQVNTRTALPQKIIGEVVAMFAVPADGVLHVSGEKESLPAHIRAAPDDSIHRSCAQGKIVTVNA